MRMHFTQVKPQVGLQVGLLVGLLVGLQVSLLVSLWLLRTDEAQFHCLWWNNSMMFTAHPLPDPPPPVLPPPPPCCCRLLSKCHCSKWDSELPKVASIIQRSTRASPRLNFLLPGCKMIPVNDCIFLIRVCSEGHGCVCVCVVCGVLLALIVICLSASDSLTSRSSQELSSHSVLSVSACSSWNIKLFKCHGLQMSRLKTILWLFEERL